MPTEHFTAIFTFSWEVYPLPNISTDFKGGILLAGVVQCSRFGSGLSSRFGFGSGLS